jgi:hypothetical protein
MKARHRKLVISRTPRVWNKLNCTSTVRNIRLLSSVCQTKPGIKLCARLCLPGLGAQHSFQDRVSRSSLTSKTSLTINVMSFPKPSLPLFNTALFLRNEHRRFISSRCGFACKYALALAELWGLNNTETLRDRCTSSSHECRL